MSYILDALRKADAERERGNVPGVHAQPDFARAQHHAARNTSPPWVLALAAAAVVLLVIVAVMVWKMSGTATAPVNVASGQVPAVAAPAPTAVASAAMPSVATPTALPPATPAVSTSSPQPVPKPAPAVRKPKPVASSAASAPAVPSATARAAEVTSPKASSTPAPASAEQRVYTIGELPDDVRRALPSLTVGGSVYSTTPANRFLFLNGQVVHEGDVVAPGVVLQLIKLKAAVLAFKGLRYQIEY